MKASDGVSGVHVLHRSERTLIQRHTLAGGTETRILKQAFGADAATRLHHERAILQRLRGVPGVVQLADAETPSHTLAFVDDHATPLSALPGPLDVPKIVTLGLALAHTLGRVHDAGVVHRDINPSNILVHPHTLAPTLIDFNIARDLGDKGNGATEPNTMAGTLRYMAPEQTGRTGRGVDQRADLYALGVVLYELCVGHVPFQSDDLLQLLHDQLVTVPPPPLSARPDLPPMLSAIIVKLLEKAPQNRYQSAQGLAMDLAQVATHRPQGDLAQGLPAGSLGRFDFPKRLAAPAQVVGRDTELAALQTALDQAIAGQSHCIWVKGEAGVGKSALVATLRSMVSAREGWFVSGKYAQYNPGAATVVTDMLTTLARHLLAEPQDRLEPVRNRIVQRLGINLGFGPALLPELVLLLGSHAAVTVSDPRDAEARWVQATLDLLRAIASPQRPLVMVMDDLQWAGGAISLQIMDALVNTTEPIAGLLLVGVFQRDAKTDLVDLQGMRKRWAQSGVQVPVIHLANLPVHAIATLLQNMLRMEASPADALAQLLQAHTNGNPDDTVELLNALWQDGLLHLDPGTGGWQWDAAALGRYVGGNQPARMLERRIQALPTQALGALQVLACLGWKATVDALAFACDLALPELVQRLEWALHDGLITSDAGEDATVRFAHERVQQAVLDLMGPTAQRECHLRLAHTLARHAPHERLAAEQYLKIAGAPLPEDECRKAIALLHQELARTRVDNFEQTERALTAAIHWLDTVRSPADQGLWTQLHLELHAALYALSRLDAADEVFGRIARSGLDPVELVPATELQLFSLTYRSRHQESTALGLASLAALGLAMPEDARPYIRERLPQLIAWCHSAEKAGDFARAEITDGRTLAALRLIMPTAHAAFFFNATVSAWIGLKAHQMWVDQGPCAALLAPLGVIPYYLCGRPQDYRGAYLGSQHLHAVGQARGYGAYAAMACHYFGLLGGHWVDPVEHSVALLRQARAVFLQVGNSAFLADSYLASDMVLEIAPSLDEAARELTGALAVTRRTSNTAALHYFLPRHQLVLALYGSTSALGSFSDRDFDAALDTMLHSSSHSYNPPAWVYHSTRSIGAAIFGDAQALATHTAQATAMALPGYYLTALVPFLLALSLCEQARTLPVAERAAVLDTIDQSHLPWLQSRAADAPANFAHLLRWIEAERAWAGDDVWAAGAAFDTAVRDATTRQRPWHCALITERAGLFRLAQGMQTTGQSLIEQACHRYAAWGAVGKVRHLHQCHAWLGAAETGADQRPPPRERRRNANAAWGTIRSTTTHGPDMVDVLAVLRASQALSSETSLTRLTQRLVEVLKAMTGATGAQLLVYPDAQQGWILAGHDTAMSLEQAGAQGLLSLSVLRYVQRTGQTLIVDDTTQDDRFSKDPYFAPLSSCSVLCAPIHSHGVLRGILWLESRAASAAFNAARLDAIHLISGQISVSLENALLYASLEERVGERTQALSQALAHLQKTQQELLQAEKLASLGALVAGVAHELNTPIGNALVTASSMANDARELGQHLAAGTLKKSMLDSHTARYLQMSTLVQHSCERAASLISSFKQVAVDQTSEQRRGFDLQALIADNLSALLPGFQQARWTVHNAVARGIVCESYPGPLGQVIASVVQNADVHAFSGLARGTLTISAVQTAGEVELCFQDDGKGMPPGTLAHIFEPFYTTTLGKGGSGLGLAIVRNIVTGVLGGSIHARSEVGLGTAFVVRFPQTAPEHKRGESGDPCAEEAGAEQVVPKPSDIS